MQQATISFRTKNEYKETLNKIAIAQDRSLSSVINRAIANHLAYRKEQLKRIRIAKKQVVGGEVYDRDVWEESFLK